MELFEIKDDELRIHPAAYALEPFRVLWVRKGRKKERASQELAYIFFMIDYRSDFRHVYPEEERERLVLQSLGLPESFKPDALLQKAMTFYETMQDTANMKMLKNLRKSWNELVTYFEEVNFSDVDKSGKPVYDINKYKSTVKELPELVESIEKFEKLVTKQLRDAGSEVGGAKSKALFEDE